MRRKGGCGGELRRCAARLATAGILMYTRRTLRFLRSLSCQRRPPTSSASPAFQRIFARLSVVVRLNREVATLAHPQF
jgi:hypothetical protein